MDTLDTLETIIALSPSVRADFYAACANRPRHIGAALILED